MYKKKCTNNLHSTKIVVHLLCQNKTTMKTSKNTTAYVNQLSVIMPRQNGTPAQFAALAASLNRGKELTK